MKNARDKELFAQLVHGEEQVTSQFFKSKYKWSKSQLDYSLKNINEWLLEQNYPKITRDNKGYFHLNSDVRKIFLKGEGAVEIFPGYFREDLRLLLSQLILLANGEFLSTYWFMNFFQVSRNTVLRDLKKIKEELSERKLLVKYDTEIGYTICGEEWDKRRLLLEIVEILIKEKKEFSFVEKATGIEKETFQKVKKLLQKIENHLNLRFSDEKLPVLSYFIPLLHKRLAQDEPAVFTHQWSSIQLTLFQTKPCVELIEMLHALGFSEEEEKYLALLLWSSNRKNSPSLHPSAVYHRLEKAMREIIDEFSSFLMIEINQKDELIKQLMLHMEAAYYRLTAHLVQETQRQISEAQYFPIYYLMKEFVSPLEIVLEESLPEDEIFFLSIFVGSHLLSNNFVTKGKKTIKKALIVCKNGVYVSNYYLNVLTVTFPEISFVDVISIRDVPQNETEVDYYFSTEFIQQAKKPVFFLRNLLSTLEEKQRFRQQVLEETKNFGEGEYDLEKMKVLFRHFENEDQARKVLAEILEMLNENRPPIFNKKEFVFQCIENMPIQIFQQESWQGCVQKLGALLIQEKIITKTYVDKVLDQYPEISPSIVLREVIALPHVAGDQAVYGTGFAMGIVKEGIRFKKNQRIYLIILLATNSKEGIAETMLELVRLSGQKEVIENLKSSSSVREARNQLKRYFKEGVIL